MAYRTGSCVNDLIVRSRRCVCFHWDNHCQSRQKQTDLGVPCDADSVCKETCAKDAEAKCEGRTSGQVGICACTHWDSVCNPELTGERINLDQLSGLFFIG